MALILAAPASGKTNFVRNNGSAADLVDGDELILIPKDRPDPAHWTQSERQAHMHGFQTHIIAHPNSICVGFSNVCIDSFDVRGIPTVIVEVPEDSFNEYINCRHRNLRKGCYPRPNCFYHSQRAYLRKLAEAHGLRVYTSFESAIATILDCRPYCKTLATGSDSIKKTIDENGFCIIPNFLSRELKLELEMKRSILHRTGAKLSNHLSNSLANNLHEIPLKDTIYQHLNPHLQMDKKKSTFHVAQSLLSFMDELLDIKRNEHAYLFNDTLLTKTKDHKCRLHWHQVRRICASFYFC